MTTNKKIILFPGAFRTVQGYQFCNGQDIWRKKYHSEESLRADYFIGHSAGAHVALSYLDNNPNSTFILINPLIKKRNATSLLFQAIRFLLFEGIKWNTLIPLSDCMHALKKVFTVLRTDIADTMKKIPSEHIIVIRGTRDTFYCDATHAELIKKNGIRLIEVDAGHDWNDHIAEAVTHLVSTSKA